MKTAVIAVLLLASPAFGHARLQSSVPARGASVKSPKTITLTFVEALEPAFSGAELADAAGKAVPVPSAVNGSSITLLPFSLRPGRLYRDVAQRGTRHPSPHRQFLLQGHSVTLILARGIYFAAAMLLFGGAVFRALLRSRLKMDVAGPLRRSMTAIALVSGCAWLMLAAAGMAGALNAPAVTQTLTGTLFGQVYVLRLAALLGLLLAPDGWIAAALAGLVLALPAITGHAAGSSPAGFIAIGATLDAVHLLAAGLWIGGLAVLLAVRKRPQFIAALALFSDFAMVAVLLLVMTGLINAVSILLGDQGTAAPFYLGVLGAKLVLVLVMLGLAGINRFRLLPGSAAGTIARNAAIELALGAAVILLAGWLGQLQPTL